MKNHPQFAVYLTMRPTISASDKRRVWPLTLKVSFAEAELIRTRASEHGIPIGRYMRECAINGHIAVTHPIAADQWGQLARLAGNLNTLARHANQGRIPDSRTLLLTLTELSKQLAEIRTNLIA